LVLGVVGKALMVGGEVGLGVTEYFFATLQVPGINSVDPILLLPIEDLTYCYGVQR
jgi:hypothetical protein